jgi:hypothetical protein
MSGQLLFHLQGCPFQHQRILRAPLNPASVVMTVHLHGLQAVFTAAHLPIQRLTTFLPMKAQMPNIRIGRGMPPSFTQPAIGFKPITLSVIHIPD